MSCVLARALVSRSVAITFSNKASFELPARVNPYTLLPSSVHQAVSPETSVQRQSLSLGLSLSLSLSHF